MKLSKIALLLVLTQGMVMVAEGQEKPKKPPKERTREDAIKEQQAKSKAYDDNMKMGRKQHVQRQDKATQKRMKKNLRRAEKQSWGKDIPWYKRWFSKKKLG